MIKRIYRDKKYWINQAFKNAHKLPSECLRELIDENCWNTLEKEIPIIKDIINKLNK